MFGGIDGSSNANRPHTKSLHSSPLGEDNGRPQTAMAAASPGACCGPRGGVGRAPVVGMKVAAQQRQMSFSSCPSDYLAL